MPLGCARAPYQCIARIANVVAAPLRPRPSPLALGRGAVARGTDEPAEGTKLRSARFRGDGSALFMFDVVINNSIVEIVTHDRIKKMDGKIGFGHSFFVRLPLKTKRYARGKRNYQSLWKRPVRMSKTNSVLGAFHSQASQLASNPLSDLRRA
jgi:hypothetical protein